MPSAERPHRPAVLPLAATLALVGSGIFVAQFLTDAPFVGLGGLVALFAPGVIVALAASARLRRRPSTVLVVLAVTLVLIVLIGIAAALTPRGLGPQTVAGIGQLVLTIAFAGWFLRARHLLAPTTIPASSTRPSRRAVALVVAGIAMAGAGMVVARGAAQAQAYAGYVTLWSGRSPSSGAPVVAVGNASGASLQCSVELTRPGAAPTRWSTDAIADGATWEHPLPIAASDERAAWRVDLQCTEPSGATLERQLRIDPPA
jgi:hypothetical protein